MKKLCLLIFVIAMQQGNAQPAFSKAQSLVNECIDAMGGADGFHETKYIAWNFFGYRRIIWDKENNRIRVEYLKKQLTIITYLHKDEGYLYMNGQEVTEPDSLKKYFDKARRVWMNDSYWLVMPFKLRDNGVVLQYAGEEKSMLGTDCEVIQLTFDNVGATPENKYLVYINKQTKLVDAWKYFETFEDATPNISNTWTEYAQYGKIMLSGNRGSEGKLTEIHTWQSVPEYVFIDREIPPFDMLDK
jgi:hypothetical protein